MRLRVGVLALAVALAGPGVAAPSAETGEEAICRLIEAAAAAERLPVAFLTRLIWKESSFRADVQSPAGAQGIAQFMPGTAAERGLTDPFDPELAIPASAAFVRDLADRFGNLGLAAAGYNGGPNRVARWIENGGFLPVETEDYVLFVTGRAAEDWRADRLGEAPATPPADVPVTDCRTAVAAAKVEVPSPLIEGPMAPWGVQLSGNFSKSRAIAGFRRVQARHADLLREVAPVVLGNRLRGRGTRLFYRVRAPFETRREANAFCAELRRDGGACVVFRN